MLIVRTLVLGAANGHQIAKHIQQTTDDFLQVEHGSLYPALHRLEGKGWISGKWEAAEKGSAREFKFYRLTADGKATSEPRAIQVAATDRGDCQNHVACERELSGLLIGRSPRRCSDVMVAAEGAPAGT